MSNNAVTPKHERILTYLKGLSTHVKAPELVPRLANNEETMETIAHTSAHIPGISNFILPLSTLYKGIKGIIDGDVKRSLLKLGLGTAAAGGFLAISALTGGIAPAALATAGGLAAAGYGVGHLIVKQHDREKAKALLEARLPGIAQEIAHVKRVVLTGNRETDQAAYTKVMMSIAKHANDPDIQKSAFLFEIRSANEPATYYAMTHREVQNALSGATSAVTPVTQAVEPFVAEPSKADQQTIAELGERAKAAKQAAQAYHKHPRPSPAHSTKPRPEAGESLTASSTPVEYLSAEHIAKRRQSIPFPPRLEPRQ